MQENPLRGQRTGSSIASRWQGIPKNSINPIVRPTHLGGVAVGVPEIELADLQHLPVGLLSCVEKHFHEVGLQAYEILIPLVW
jgi:hypothetical protein